jgi:outer membrane protein
MTFINKIYEKKKMTKNVFMLATMLLLTVAAQAQKFGHINVGNLLEQFREVKSADSTMLKLRDGLSVKGQEMVKKAEADYAKYIEDANKGILTPVESQKREADLQKQQADIESYRQKVGQDLETKRQELLKPILDRVENAITAVGKENKYTFIFDTSTGAMLFAAESNDVTPMVKAKLGIK